MKYIIYFLTGFAMFFCTVPEAEIPVEELRESCDYSICEEGRISVDTIRDVYGVLRQRNDVHYIEVTGNAPEPDTLFVSCIASQIDLPDADNYVRCAGLIKDPCGENTSTLSYSLFLQDIEVVYPLEQETCETQIIAGEFDKNKIVENLNILHLELVGDCLHILVSYLGNCDRLPSLTLHYSEDIKFGRELDVRLQGSIDGDCSQRNYALLKYDLTPLKKLKLPNLTLFFISQGYMRVGVSFD